jgi:FKBP12-rapamycin complex-associated protein
MNAHYYNVCDLILKHKESKDSIIRKMVITLIPHMAGYDPQSFTDEGGTSTGVSFLTTSMRYLLAQLKRPERGLGASFSRSSLRVGYPSRI